MPFNYLNLTLAAVILGLGIWSWQQSQKISSLEATNQAQAQTIQEQEKANQRLTSSLETERQAVETQKALTDELQKVTDEKISQFSTALKTQPCAVTRLPDDVINGLRAKGYH